MKLRRVYQKHGAHYAVTDLPELRPDGKHKQKWTRLCAVKDGEAALLKRLADIRGDVAAKGGNLPDRLKDFKKVYLPTLKNLSVRKEYERVYDLAAEAFVDFDTEQIVSGDIADFIDGDFPARKNGKDQAMRKLSPRARVHIKSRLSTFFAWCCGPKRYATVNPCAQFKLKHSKKGRKYPWTPAKWHAIRDALLVDGNGKPTDNGPMLQVYMDLAFLLYQRNTDVRLLGRHQIDRERRLIHFTPKKTEDSSGATVSVPLTAAMEEVIDRAEAIAKGYRAAALAKGKSVAIPRYVVCKPDGLIYTASGIRSAWVKACKRAGVEGLTSKSIRNYAARMAKEAGYHTEQIQAGLAHTSMATTEGYLATNAEVISAITLAPLARPKGNVREI